MRAFSACLLAIAAMVLDFLASDMHVDVVGWDWTSGVVLAVALYVLVWND